MSKTIHINFMSIDGSAEDAFEFFWAGPGEKIKRNNPCRGRR